MCRYGFHAYKPHYLCFNCRKQFKQSILSEKMGDDYDRFQRMDKITKGTYQLPKYHVKYKRDQVFVLTEQEQIDYEILKKRYFSPIVCPQCRQPMYETGKDTKAPKMSDKDAWKALENTHKLGYTFHSCGCSGPGFIPSDKADYEEFLEQLLTQYENNYQKAIKVKRTGKWDETLSNDDKIYWAERVDKIKEALSKTSK